MTPFHKRFACILTSFVLLAVALAAQTFATEFNVAVAYAPKTLDPATATDAAASRVLQMTHPALLRWNAQYQPIGLSALGCTQPSPIQVICQLDPRRTFTDGQPLTAPLLQRWFSQVQANPRSPFTTPLKNVSITAPAPSQLVFTLPSPTLTFMGTLTEIPLAHPDSPTVGLGPYQVEELDPLGNVKLVSANPNLPTLNFLFVADATTRLLKLKKGEVDIVLNDLTPELFDWAGKQGFSTTSVSGTSYGYLGLNFENPNLANPLVREALSLAINRPALRKYLLGGLAEPASSILPASHPAAWAVAEEPFDPFTAEERLDETDLLRGPDNNRITLTLLTSTDAFIQRIAQVLQRQLAEVGITLRLQPTEWAAFYDAVKKGRFDMALLAWTGEQQPAFYSALFNSTQAPPNGFNRGHVSDTQIDALTSQIIAAPNFTEQNSLTVQLQQYLATFRPYIPLYKRHQLLVTAPNITGCTLLTTGAYLGMSTCHRK